MRSLLMLLVTSLPVVAAEKLVPFVTGLHEPFGMDFFEGELVFTEHVGHRLLHIDSAGKVTPLAGSGKKGSKDGVGTAAEFNAPHNLAVAKDGIIYIADTMNHRVRKYDSKTKAVTTIAGSDKGFAGDGGKAIDAKFDQVYHVALDADAKNLYVCDLGNRRIRKIDLAVGTIVTVAGNGKKGVPGNGGKAVDEPLVDPRVVTVDAKGGLWILERSGHALRSVKDGLIVTAAGTGEQGFAGDGGPALKAKFNGPKYLWIDPAGDVLIADTENHCIRRLSLKDGTVTRIAGTGKKGKEAASDLTTEIPLNRPHGVAIGPDGTMYVADSDNGRVLKSMK